MTERHVRVNLKAPPDDVTTPPCPPGGMTLEEYRVRAKEMVDYISTYLETIRDRRVFPDVSPGYMAKLVPDACPERPEAWNDIFADVERVIMPGMTHWQSPHNHAYFPALNCFPSLLGDMLADAINCLGFTWASSPACTELETIVLDWLGKMLGLPPSFLHGNETGQGGGCIQTTASECTFVTLLAARTDAIKRFKVTAPDMDDSEINGRLIMYCSDQAHSSVEKAGLIGLVKLRFLPTDEHLSLRGDTLQEAVYRDRDMGLIPFYVCATLGTTGACAFDNLKEIGPVCQSENLWLHIDAAYAGSAFICPEYRTLMAGIEHAHSFAFNPSKWLMVHFDCSAMWVKDATALHRTFNVEPLYLQHENSGAAIDYMHWQIALSRRFRSLKLWFVLRSYGVEGLQSHIRRGVERSIYFEKLVRSDRRFEVTARRYLGMVVFRMVGPNQLTETLLKRLNKQGEIHMVPASLKGKYIIRFTVTSQYTTVEDIERDWKIIVDMATKILHERRSMTEESILEKEEEEDEDDLEQIIIVHSPKDNNFDQLETKSNLNRANGNAKPLINGVGAKTNGNENTHNMTDKSNLNDDGEDDHQDDNNDDDDNDERNRKMKKMMSSTTRKDTKDHSGTEVGDNIAVEKLSGVKKINSTELNTTTQKQQEINMENIPIHPQITMVLPQDSKSGSGSGKPERKLPSTNLKILNQKSAAAKRRDYGISLLLSNVPMSPKIVNGSFAALFDGYGACNSLDLSQMTRKLGIDGEFIRLSPRKRGRLGEAEKQLSLDYGVLSASSKTCPARMQIMGSLDSKIDDILELTTILKGKGGEKKDGKNKKEMEGGKNNGDEEGEGNKVRKDGSENDDMKRSMTSGGVQDERGRKGNDIGDKGNVVLKNKENDVGDENVKQKNTQDKAQVRVKDCEKNNVGKVKCDGSGLGRSENEGKRGGGLMSDVKDGRVNEKENWDTGHHGDVTDKVESNWMKGENAGMSKGENFVNNSGEKKERENDINGSKGQMSICPLCGRGGNS